MRKMILLLPAAALLMTGCGSLVSTSPIYSDETVIQDAGLIGAWQAANGDDILVVLPAEDQGYQVLYTSMKDSASTMKFDVRLVQLSGSRFLDVVRDTGGWAVPGHCFAKISRDGDVVKFSFFDADWVKQSLVAERPSLAQFKRGELLVLPDSTPTLQQMLRKYANEPRAFDGETEIHRIHQ